MLILSSELLHFCVYLCLCFARFLLLFMRSVHYSLAEASRVVVKLENGGGRGGGGHDFLESWRISKPKISSVKRSRMQRESESDNESNTTPTMGLSKRWASGSY